MFLQSAEDTCVQNLEKKFAESEEELNHIQSSEAEENQTQTQQESFECTEIVPEKRGRALETPDSIGDMQVTVYFICVTLLLPPPSYHFLEKKNN